jgi:hypothetical protein
MMDIVLFTTHRFDTDRKAEQFLQLLVDEGGPFAPSRFDRAEPVKRAFDRAHSKEAARLLSGSPSHKSGELFLKGAAHKALMWLRWSQTAPIQTWRLYLDDAYFTRGAGSDQLGSIIDKFPGPLVFAAAATRDDWRRKHYRITEEDGGTTEEKLGMDLRNCLPGVYWMTVFGPDLVELFGTDNLLALPVEQARARKGGAVQLILTADPVRHAEERQRREQQVVDALGPAHFFDLQKPEKRCPKVRNALVGSGRETG